MPTHSQVISGGYTVVAREPIDIQIELATTRGIVFVPVKEISFKKTQAMTSEHSSGTALPYHLTEGAIDYEGEFSVGTWFTESDQHENAEVWEKLLYYFLERPADEGRPVEFHIRLHQREYPTDVDGNGEGGGQVWVELQRCKLTGDSYTQGETGTVKRTYPFKFLRRVVGEKKESGGFVEPYMSGTAPDLSNKTISAPAVERTI